MALRQRVTTIDDKTPKDDYRDFLRAPAGTLLHIPSGYETVLNRIREYYPQDATLELAPINPGTELYSQFGSNHLIIVKNTNTKSYLKWTLGGDYVSWTKDNLIVISK